MLLIAASAAAAAKDLPTPGTYTISEGIAHSGSWGLTIGDGPQHGHGKQPRRRAATKVFSRSPTRKSRPTLCASMRTLVTHHWEGGCAPST